MTNEFHWIWAVINRCGWCQQIGTLLPTVNESWLGTWSQPHPSPGWVPSRGCHQPVLDLSVTIWSVQKKWRCPKSWGCPQIIYFRIFHEINHFEDHPIYGNPIYGKYGSENGEIALKTNFDGTDYDNPIDLGLRAIRFSDKVPRDGVPQLSLLVYTPIIPHLNRIIGVWNIAVMFTNLATVLAIIHDCS